MPLSHYGIPVGDHFEEMKAWYLAVLKPLGYELMVEGPQHCGFGTKGTGPDFWLGGGCEGGLQKYNGKLEERVAPVHVAFSGNTQQHVGEWYENAMKFGAIDNGKPGLREHYCPGYYAAFVLDPLGNNIEVIHLSS